MDTGNIIGLCFTGVAVLVGAIFISILYGMDRGGRNTYNKSKICVPNKYDDALKIGQTWGTPGVYGQSYIVVYEKGKRSASYRLDVDNFIKFAKKNRLIDITTDIDWGKDLVEKS